jgi:hypothetical protein
VGSSPISHPKNSLENTKGYKLRLVALSCFWKMNSNFMKATPRKRLLNDAPLPAASP